MIYFFRFLSGGKPLSNSDVDKLIDFDTNLPRPLIGRFIPFIFTVFGSVTRSDFLVVDLEKKKKKTVYRKLKFRLVESTFSKELGAVNYLSVYVNRFCGNGAFGLLNSFVNDFGGSRNAKLFA